MNLVTWATRWGIPAAALMDLHTQMGLEPAVSVEENTSQSEAGVQSRVRLKASKQGGRLFRNNVGATYTQEGAFLRYGLANDTPQMNKDLKSADLIGIRPRIITPDLVGSLIGQFWSRECKAPGWRYTGTPHEVAQMNWAALILRLGGDAGFCSDEGQL